MKIMYNEICDTDDVVTMMCDTNDGIIMILIMVKMMYYNMYEIE